MFGFRKKVKIKEVPCASKAEILCKKNRILRAQEDELKIHEKAQSLIKEITYYINQEIYNGGERIEFKSWLLTRDDAYHENLTNSIVNYFEEKGYVVKEVVDTSEGMDKPMLKISWGEEQC